MVEAAETMSSELFVEASPSPPPAENAAKEESAACCDDVMKIVEDAEDTSSSGSTNEQARSAPLVLDMQCSAAYETVEAERSSLGEAIVVDETPAQPDVDAVAGSSVEEETTKKVLAEAASFVDAEAAGGD